MNRAGFRTLSLMVGIATVLAIPGVAAGQIDPAQTVGDAVGEVGDAIPQVQVPTPAVPVQPPAVPVQPVAPRQVTPSAPAAQVPSSSGSGGGASNATGQASGGGSGSSAAAGSGDGGTRKAGAKAASSGGGGGKADRGRGVVLAQEDGSLAPPEGQSYSGVVTTDPDTGVSGDPDLPFTGGHLVYLLALGAVALAAGMALRTAVRRRHAG